MLFPQTPLPLLNDDGHSPKQCSLFIPLCRCPSPVVVVVVLFVDLWALCGSGDFTRNAFTALGKNKSNSPSVKPKFRKIIAPIAAGDEMVATTEEGMNR